VLAPANTHIFSAMIACFSPRITSLPRRDSLGFNFSKWPGGFTSRIFHIFTIYDLRVFSRLYVDRSKRQKSASLHCGDTALRCQCCVALLRADAEMTKYPEPTQQKEIHDFTTVGCCICTPAANGNK